MQKPNQKPSESWAFPFGGMDMTTLLLVRHGLSLANREKFFARQADVPLLPMGQLQARATGAFLREHYAAHKVYASDLVRAGETGQILAEILGCPLETDKGLREIYAGAWQEKTFDYLTERYPEAYGVWRQDIGKAQCPPGGVGGGNGPSGQGSPHKNLPGQPRQNPGHRHPRHPHPCHGVLGKIPGLFPDGRASLGVQRLCHGAFL